MMESKRRRIRLGTILVLFSFCSYAFADSVIVLKHRVQPVASESSARYVTIAWSGVLRNTTSAPQTCKMTLSFLNAEDEVISEATETQELDPRQERTVKGTVRLRTSIAQQIVATDVSVVTE